MATSLEMLLATRYREGKQKETTNIDTALT